MSYSQFNLSQAIETFELSLVEGGSLLEFESVIFPSGYLEEFITTNLKLAIALNTEKARSELIICPVLLALKQVAPHIALFSGEEFNVDASLGLTGTCDYVISHSSEQSYIKAPIAMIVEAKKENLKGGIGQCIAEMVAAWKFNQAHHNSIHQIYGVVTTGTLWRFLKLENQTVFIDLQEYPLPPLSNVLSQLFCMVHDRPTTNLPNSTLEAKH